EDSLLKVTEGSPDKVGSVSGTDSNETKEESR
ncbi:MAG: SUF system NifU family Fe-S cluster assembly protein, partial [Actinomycetota bacterium]